MRKLLAAVLALSIPVLLHAQTWQPTWQSLDQRPVPEWYKDAKFGIFIHWGVYSVPGWSKKGEYAEWYQHGLNSGEAPRIQYQKKTFGDLSYYQLADRFKAELYNPDEWAHIIEQSGAKYVVLTSKHHDGFANWPSKENAAVWNFPWNAGSAGPHRDLLGDLFTAIRKTSVHPGMYYSLYEWYNPLWLKDRAAYVSTYMWPQMKDLINTYRPEVLWTDGDWDASDSLWKSKEFLAWLYNESPVKDRIVTYDRWGTGIRFHHGAVYTPEYQPNADFEDHYWEESRGMGFSYGYNREEDAWDYNSSQALVFQLIDKVSRGGNFLLDIGPDEHGKIPPIMQERLLQIGDWMKVNGEAIYNTVRWRIASQWSAGRQDYKPANGGGDLLLKLTVDPDPGYAVKECFFTYNPQQNDLYVLLPKWPASSASSVAGGASFAIRDLAPQPGTQIEFLETHANLSWHQQGNDLVVDLPAFDPNRIKNRYGYVLKIHNTGAFAARPVVQISYPAGLLNPQVSVAAREDITWHYTLDGTVPVAASPVYKAPFVVEMSSQLSVRGFKTGTLPGNTVTVPLHVFHWQSAGKAGKPLPGLHVDAYEGSTRSLSDQSAFTLVKSGITDRISTAPLSRKENAALTFDGYIKIPADAIYTFYLSSDDGSRFWLDGDELIDNDGLHGNDGQMTGTAALKQGLHRIRLAYFNAAGNGSLLLQYATTEKTAISPIPASWFFRANAPN